MKIAVLILTITFTMFAATTRAFVSRVAIPGTLSRHSLAASTGRTSTTGSTRRWMTSDASTSETSVVSICQQKIQTALEAESVKVTGAYIWIAWILFECMSGDSKILFSITPLWWLWQAPLMIRMDHTLVFRSYRPCLKERGRCNDNNWSIRLYGKNSKGRSTPSIPWSAKRPVNNKWSITNN